MTLRIMTADQLPDLPQRPTPERDTNPTGRRLTYAELEERDERLAALRVAIAAVGRNPADEFCANHWWYGRRGFKSDLTNIIGSWAEQPDLALRTSAAWDTAYQHLYHLLPDCRHEGMCWKGRQ